LSRRKLDILRVLDEKKFPKGRALRELFIELGNKTPTIEYIEYICDALKISLVTFFDINDEGEPLNKKILALTDKQKRKLAEFLDSMI
jgi:transcriptional regulator with XRE-family HTH domain